MALKVYCIYQAPSRNLNIVYRNYGYEVPPQLLAPSIGTGERADYIEINTNIVFTELNITRMDGLTATVQLEHNKKTLTISGTIEGGTVVVSSHKIKGFDIDFTDDGKMALRCREGQVWETGNAGEHVEKLEFDLAPFTR